MTKFFVAGVEYTDSFFKLEPLRISSEAPILEYQVVSSNVLTGGAGYIYKNLKNNGFDVEYLKARQSHDYLRNRYLTNQGMVHFTKSIVLKESSGGIDETVLASIRGDQYIVLDIAEHVSVDEFQGQNKIINLRAVDLDVIQDSLIVRLNVEILNEVIREIDEYIPDNVEEKIVVLQKKFNIKHIFVTGHEYYYIYANKDLKKRIQMVPELCSGVYIGEKFFLSIILSFDFKKNRFNEVELANNFKKMMESIY
jgi:hypothetical protein